MSPLRRFAANGVAIHDLSHIDTLSDVAEIVLLVSERTLYVLQNLVAAEALWQARYAVDISEAGYIPVADDDAEWPLYISTINALGSEVYPVVEWKEWNLPVVKQGGAECEIDPETSQYVRLGDIVILNLACTIANGSGSPGAISVEGLPDDAIPADGAAIAGSMGGIDPGSRHYSGIVSWATNGAKFNFIDPGSGDFIGSTPAWTLAVNDRLWFSIVYRGA